jgi:DNA primase
MKTTVTKSPLREIFPGLEAIVVLSDIIGAHNIIDSGGEEIIHSCPLPFGMHKNGDANPSASLNKETLLFNCFTCGGGSVVWLVQHCLNVSREEAIAILKDEVTELKLVQVEDFIKNLQEMFKHEEAREIEIPVYSEIILNRWKGTADYLTDRGVSEEIQKVMRTGIERGRVEKARTPRGEELVKVDRVVIPHFIKGKLVGWVSRKINNVEGVPKYVNSKGFPRGAWMYNLDEARNYDNIYVVESPMSVLVLRSRGINNVAATFGAKVDHNQIELLRQFSMVTVFMDGDSAGRAATAKIIEEISPYTRLAVIDTPEGEDPASLSEIPSTVSTLEWQLKNQLVS